MSWEIIEPQYSHYQEKFGASALAGMLMGASGLDDSQAWELLDPSMKLSTSKAKCVLQAVERIMLAKKRDEKVFVGGDYDADGICATTIMKDTLDRLGIVNGYYIPDRFKEGYGLSASTVEKVHGKGYSLIITVDNGVKAHEAIEMAHSLGMEIIVTDHHRIEEEVKADIVVHPDYMEEACAYFCGAAVALQLSRNLLGYNKAHTVLAAIASIGDVMPMWKETRRIVKHGLDLLNRGEVLPSVQSLIKSAYIDETIISFSVVPKLNSVGRMNDISNVNSLVKFLVCQDRDQILHYAQQLENVNDARKSLSESEALRAFELCEDDLFPIVFDESFHEGICGLVAGKLAAKLKKPILVMARNGSLIKGSGRSVEGFDMFNFFSDFSELAAFGGHSMAVGLSVEATRLEEFLQHVKDKMEAVAFHFEAPVRKAIKIHPWNITFEEIDALRRLSPYPREMFPPLFLIEAPFEKTFSSEKVAKYSSTAEDCTLEGVLFTRKEVEAIERPSRLIGTLGVNRYRDKVICQMEIEDMS